MFRRILALFALASVVDGLEFDVMPAQRSPRSALAADNADVAQTARDRVQKWSKMGMWLPDDDVPFFQHNFSKVEKVLRDALIDSNDAIRQRAAYVVKKLGPTASPLEPVLIQRIEKEPSRLVRMYLVGAARSVGAKSEKMLAVLKTRFAALEKEPEVRAHSYDYTAIDERIEIAGALLNSDDVPARKAEYRDFVLRWLKPVPTDLSGPSREDYWEHRWIAVTVVENTASPQEAIPLLEAMLKEPGKKPWVYLKVSRALNTLKCESQPKADASKTSNPGQDFLRSLFGLNPAANEKEPDERPRTAHRKELPARHLAVSFDDSGTAIVVSRGNLEKRLSLPAGSFWDEPVFTSNGQYVFAIANSGSQTGGYSAESIYRIQLPDANDGLDSIKQERVLSTTGLKCAEFKNPRVITIYTASDDGKRLLVLVGYRDIFKSNARTTYSGYRPFFLDLDSKYLRPVVP